MPKLVAFLPRSLWLLFLLCASALAAPLDLSRSASSLTVPVNSDFLFVDQPLSDPQLLPGHAWQPWSGRTLHLIGETRQLWLRVPLQLSTEVDWRLLSEWPQMGQIQAWLRQGEQVQALARLERQRYPTFSLPPGSGAAELLIAVQYPDISLVPLRLLPEAELQGWREQTNLWLGAFFGLGLAVILFNLLLWLATRGAEFLWYVLFQLAVYSFEAIRFGLLVPYLGESSHGRAFVFSAGLAFLLGNMFAARLLQIPELHPGDWRWYRALFAVLSLYVALLATPWSQPLLWSAMPVACFGAVVPVLMALLYARQARVYLRFYSLAWGLLILGTLVLNLNLVGLLPMSWLSTYGQLIGLSIEAVLLSFVLGARMNDLQRERAQIAAELISLKQEANQRLQQEVEEKTRALNQALAELQRVNAGLAERAITDQLTGLYNRRHFDEMLVKALNRASREGSWLSLALLDIDHFKSFNDRYGHLVGDACLQQVAAALRPAQQRPDDLLARYGGEEFALLLPLSQPEGAAQVLEQVRLAVQALDFRVDGAAVPVRISVGIASWQGNAAGMPPQALIEQADQQLYKAKESGRNRVCAIRLDAEASDL